MLLFKSPNAIVKEIHNAFDSAEDRLLLEAKKIISDFSSVVYDKAERLEKVGFVNSEVVMKDKFLKQTLVHSKEQANLIEYYKVKYPFQKFITEGEFDKICHKYNLIYSSVSNYIKDVPLKNLKDIETAKLLGEEDTCSENSIFRYNDSFTDNATQEQKSILKKGIIIPDDIAWEGNNSICRKHFHINYNICGYSSIGRTITKLNREGLFIAAPKSHFNLQGLTKKGFGFFEMTEIKDPIVFRYVKGGIQIITKWGLEGQDENLFNETNN